MQAGLDIHLLAVVMGMQMCKLWLKAATLHLSLNPAIAHMAQRSSVGDCDLSASHLDMRVVSQNSLGGSIEADQEGI